MTRWLIVDLRRRQLKDILQEWPRLDRATGHKARRTKSFSKSSDTRDTKVHEEEAARFQLLLSPS